jgi:peptide/nickel transport system substrate-binding protein
LEDFMARLSPLWLALGLCFFAVAQLAQAHPPAGKRLVISSSDTDWGLATPYLQGRGGMGYMLTHFVFDNLVGQDRNGALAPELARSWQRSADGFHIDITLDPGARWHDGTDLTSADVAFTFDYMARHPHPFVSLANVEAVHPLTDAKLRIDLHEPDAGFVASVLAAMPILPRHIYAGQGTPRRFTDPKAMIGSGPYRLADYDRAKGRYLFAATEAYYRGRQKYDEVMIARLTPEAAIEAAAKGQVDVIADLPNRLVDQAKTRALGVETSASGHPVKLRFDHSGLFAPVQRRQALAFAIDRDALARIAYRGGATAASLGYLQDNSRWYVPGAALEYAHNTDKAAALLLRSGWSRNPQSNRWEASGTPVTLRLVTSTREAAVAQVMKDQLAAFGLDVAIRVLERSALRKMKPGKDYDLILAGGSTLGDPVTIAQRVFGSRWNNEGYTGDGQLRALAEAQARSLDAEHRATLLAEFQHRYSKELPAIMLLNVTRTVAHTPKAAPWFFDEGLTIGIPVATHKYMLLDQ